MTSLNIGFIAIARPTFDTDLAASVTNKARKHLTEAGFTLSGPQALVMDLETAQQVADTLAAEPLDLIVAFQATFADATMLEALAAKVTTPLLLWALPEASTGGRLRLNSLCGINLGAYTLRRMDVQPEYLYVAPDDPVAVQKIKTTAQAGRALRTLRTSKVGVVGQYPDGFDPCEYDADHLQTLLGTAVKPFTQASLFQRIQAQPVDRVAARRAELTPRLANLNELEQSAVDGTLRTWESLAQLAEEEALGGLAIRCWPEFFTEMGCAACGAMSMMTDSGVPCSCEADVNGTITQILLQAMSGQPAFGTDLVSADAADDAITFWHCGLAPLSMADPAVTPRGTIHSNRKLPLLMEFPLKPGRVTIARLSESKGKSYRLVIGRGEMLSRPLAFSGTSGVCRFDNPASTVLDVIMAEGLEHHYTLTYGDFYDSLLALAQMLDIPVVKLTD